MAVKFKPERQSLRPADDLFGGASEDGVRQIRIADLVPFANHPFRVTDDEEMETLVESVRAGGILVPIVVRAAANGRQYEILSGHRRTHAAGRAGLTEVPAIVRDLDDDAATILMVDSNLQRERIRPSEKAAAFQMRMEAMRRQAGRPRQDADASARFLVGQESRDRLAKEVGESTGQIQRYIRLNFLNASLLGGVDDGTVPLNAGVALSYLPEAEQTAIAQAVADGRVKLTVEKANALREASKAGTLDMLLNTNVSREKEKPVAIRMDADVYRSFFGDRKPREIEPVIERALKAYFEQFA